LVQKLGTVIVGNVVGCKKLTLDKLVHDTNAFVAIVVTKLGIVMEVRPLQPWNALAPILVTDNGICMEVRVEQPWNALSAILVIESGSITEVSPEQFWNAFDPILMTELGIVMEVIPEQSLNALSAILVTRYITPLIINLLGIVIIPIAFAFTVTVASVTLVV